MKKSASPFQKIPGVGPSLARDFHDLGFSTVEDLRGRNPEELYQEFIKLRQQHVDRCVLYVFRLAVAFAEDRIDDPKQRNWWAWKDANLPLR